MNTLKPFAVVVLCVLAFCTNGCSSAHSDLDFRLVNRTGGALNFLYLSPSTSSKWGENILAGSEFKNGDTLRIKFNRNETAVLWDMRIEGTNGQYAEWKNLKLVDISKIKLKYMTSSQPTAVAELE